MHFIKNYAMGKEIVSKINEVVVAYFVENPKTEWIPAKAIMPSLIKEGVFIKDVKKGLPLRKVLRSLDQDNALDSIPLLHAERNENSTLLVLC